MKTSVLLGTGILTWSGIERRTDRYGTVYLIADGDTSRSPADPRLLLDVTAARAVAHSVGSLVAKVIGQRESTHIGDLFRGFSPSTPELGTELHLGLGKVFIEENDWATSIGLKPGDGRATDWLDPATLYRAHEQLVELHFIPLNGAA